MFCEVKGVAIFDNEGRKFYSKFYNTTGPLATKSGQILFEQQLFSKTSKMGAKNQEVEILFMDPFISIFKNLNDISIHIIASSDENSILIASILEAIVEALEILYRGDLDKSKLAEEIELAMLAIDEAFDEGLIVCADSQTIVERVNMREGHEPVPAQKTKKGETAFERVFSGAKQALTKSLLR